MDFLIVFEYRRPGELILLLTCLIYSFPGAFAGETW